MTETDIHKAIIAWLRVVLPDALVHHSPNEGVRGGKAGMIDGARKKAMGQMTGWPDIEVMLWSNLGPLFFEVKGPTGRISKEQDAVLTRLQELGYRVAVVHSVDDVRAELCGWGIPTREKGSTVKLPWRGLIS